MSFYGFNFQNNPNFSRLFGQGIMNRAQDAYGQGMQQFTPFNARQDGKAYLDKMRASRTPTAQPVAPQQQPLTGFFIDNMGRIVDNTNEESMMNYLKQISNRTGANPLKYMGGQEEQLRLDPSKLGLKPLMR
jgi:hypothetical protein